MSSDGILVADRTIESREGCHRTVVPFCLCLAMLVQAAVRKGREPSEHGIERDGGYVSSVGELSTPGLDRHDRCDGRGDS